MSTEFGNRLFDVPDGPPPDGLGPDDLCGILLFKMGVARMQPNLVAASEALRIKADEPGMTVAKAYEFILKMWSEYKASPRYKSEFRAKAANWLSEGDYNNPESWGGLPIVRREPKQRQMTDVEIWELDRRQNPEKYLKPAEVAQMWKDLAQVLSGKRM